MVINRAGIPRPIRLEAPSLCYPYSTQCLIGEYFCKTGFTNFQAPSLDEAWSFRKLWGYHQRWSALVWLTLKCRDYRHSKETPGRVQKESTFIIPYLREKTWSWIGRMEHIWAAFPGVSLMPGIQKVENLNISSASLYCMYVYGMFLLLSTFCAVHYKSVRKQYMKFFSINEHCHMYCADPLWIVI